MGGNAEEEGNLLPKLKVALGEDLLPLLLDFRIEGSGITNVKLELLRFEGWSQHSVLAPVHVQDVLRDVKVRYL